ncbi:unnamed protein product [Adineta steineri]|uniref:Uncharacterized protein n=1 Tax=Adineta steineri TaxID=433720 RepID=A0A815CE39_9BILA|nr:unnamed protein product [Adineta steineri]CAF4054569.1 unnamed protein product [Adineta steineri]
MSQVEGRPDAGQRGTAAQIRQYDDLNNRTKLNSAERKMVNGVIHSPDLKHTPKLDKPLNQLATKHPDTFPK